METEIKSQKKMALYFFEFLNADGFASSPGVNQVDGLPPVPHIKLDVFFQVLVKFVKQVCM
jgi:hypothetical protein